MNQKNQMRRVEQWSHLHLQISMLTEQEVTKSMQYAAIRSVRKMGTARTHPGARGDERVGGENTAISALANEIEMVTRIR